MARKGKYLNEEMWRQIVAWRKGGFTYTEICGQLAKPNNFKRFQLAEVPSEDTVRREVNRRLDSRTSLVTGISESDYRTWVQAHLENLTKLVEMMVQGLPGPAPAFHPASALYTQGRHIDVGRDSADLFYDTLRKQWISYTDSCHVWQDIESYGPRVETTRNELITLWRQVHDLATEDLRRLPSEIASRLNPEPAQPFTGLLFYHAVALALGGRGLQEHYFTWGEEITGQEDLRLMRGSFVLGTVPAQAKDSVKQTFDRSLGRVETLLLEDLKKQFTALNSERDHIAKQLQDLLVS